MENNIIDFEAKKFELEGKKRAEEAECIESKEDFIRGELYAVEGLINALEFGLRKKQFSVDFLLQSLYIAKEDLHKSLEANKGPKPIS